MTTRAAPGFFKSALDAFVRARQAQADRYVAGVLLSMDDETLHAGGYDRADLRKRATVSHL
ncbi:hypothetical protein [Kumtagia ephedrae]|jgi:hypothetical protein|uniref:Uncharacterized protein n=1 Tax=Kumtagia ephedrae TaxID=2116701 RepID=A0A2P7SQY4_9HYPH|nr:hypothetical protein [Mesorhizobium ephedrae]PSJ64900.1 hypothetical protein C7I84_04540 [Mesorhizobium ephedrae]